MNKLIFRNDRYRAVERKMMISSVKLRGVVYLTHGDDQDKPNPGSDAYDDLFDIVIEDKKSVTVIHDYERSIGDTECTAFWFSDQTEFRKFRFYAHPELYIYRLVSYQYVDVDDEASLTLKTYLNIEKFENLLRGGFCIPMRIDLFDELRKETSKELISSSYDPEEPIAIFNTLNPPLKYNENFLDGIKDPDNFKLFQFQKQKILWMHQLENRVKSSLSGCVSIPVKYTDGLVKLTDDILADAFNDGFMKAGSSSELDNTVDVRGGCIFDEHGLGKTTVAIGHCVYDHSINPNQNATLIICQSEACRRWIGTIKSFAADDSIIVIDNKRSFERLKPDTFDGAKFVIITHQFISGRSCNRRIENICGYDTYSLHFRCDKTFQIANREHAFIDDELRRFRALPFHQYKWSRVIVDDAHHMYGDFFTSFIRNLPADFIWLLSGTPVSLTHCAQVSHVSIVRMISTVKQIILDDEFIENSCSRSLIDTIQRDFMTKDTIASVSSEVQFVDVVEKAIHLRLSPAERVLYETSSLKSYTLSDEICFIILYSKTRLTCDVPKSSADVLHAFLDHIENMKVRLDGVEEDLRTVKTKRLVYFTMSEPGSVSQCDSTIHELNKKIEVLNDTMLYLQLMVDNLRKGKDSGVHVCSICLEQVWMACVTKCGHVFCHDCIASWIIQSERCPTCRQQLDVSDLIYVNDANESKLWLLRENYGTKMAHILDYLIEHHDEKIILYSRTERQAKTITNILKDQNIGFARAYGIESQRTKQIETFTSLDSGTNVFILTPEHICSGVNFDICSKVIIVDHMYEDKTQKKLVESMVLSRVHTIAQKNTVTVIRFIIDKTIEEDNYLQYKA
jgi:SNF2 family DNA or RNA helicase